MPRQRTDEQVLFSSRQIDEALAAGLSADQVIALVTARHAWRILGDIDPTTVSDDLLTALASPAADGWDAIFTRRARTILSLPTPSVSPCLT